MKEVRTLLVYRVQGIVNTQTNAHTHTLSLSVSLSLSLYTYKYKYEQISTCIYIYIHAINIHAVIFCYTAGSGKLSAPSAELV